MVVALTSSKGRSRL